MPLNQNLLNKLIQDVINEASNNGGALTLKLYDNILEKCPNFDSDNSFYFINQIAKYFVDECTNPVGRFKIAQLLLYIKKFIHPIFYFESLQVFQTKIVNKTIKERTSELGEETCNIVSDLFEMKKNN